MILILARETQLYTAPHLGSRYATVHAGLDTITITMHELGDGGHGHRTQHAAHQMTRSKLSSFGSKMDLPLITVGSQREFSHTTLITCNSNQSIYVIECIKDQTLMGKSRFLFSIICVLKIDVSFEKPYGK